MLKQNQAELGPGEKRNFLGGIKGGKERGRRGREERRGKGRERERKEEKEDSMLDYNIYGYGLSGGTIIFRFRLLLAFLPLVSTVFLPLHIFQ